MEDKPGVFWELYEPKKNSFFDKELSTVVEEFVVEKKQINGFCNICDMKTTFIVKSDNLREDLHCTECNSSNRQRQLMCTLSLAINKHPYSTLAEVAKIINSKKLTVYTAEANSAFYQKMKELIRPNLLTASEYFDGDHKSGDIIDGTLHQDLQKTSFKSSSFDIILTTEVFEHIPFADKAEKEVIRILKKGGQYCFTVPFHADAKRDKVLAKMTRWGKIIYLSKPQYHGDPVRPEDGILVYKIFSHAGMKKRFEEYSKRYQTIRLFSKTLGVVGESCFTMIVEK